MGRRDDTGGAPGWAGARIGAVAVLLVLAVVAARARARGAPTRAAGWDGALAGEVAVSIGITVLTAALVLLVLGRWNSRLGARPRRALTTGQRRQAALAALVGVLVAAGYLWLATASGFSGEGETPNGGSPPGTPGSGAPQVVPPGTTHAVPTAFVGLAVLALAVVLVLALARRVAPTGADEDTDDTDDTDDTEDDVAALARVASAGRAAISQDAEVDPKQAIVACFAAMEHALSRVGEEVAPRPEDTPHEVLRRGVAAGLVAERPAGTLLGLFREARFSSHPMGESHRRAADGALAEILAGLPTRTGKRTGERVR